MRPLRPFQRFNPLVVWIAAVAIIYGLRIAGLRPLAIVFAIGWLAFCIYSWVVPPLRTPLAQPEVGLMTNDRISALRKAVEANPDDVLLRLVLAESLVGAGETEAALDQYVVLLDQHGLPDDQLVTVGELAAANGRLALLRSCLEAARQAGVVEGTGRLQQLVDEMIAERSGVQVKVGPERRAGVRERHGRRRPRPSTRSAAWTRSSGSSTGW